MSAEFLAFEAVLNILSNLKDANQKPIFKEVDEFHGQYEDEDGKLLWTTPAALIEMVNIDWEDDVRNREQYGDLTFRIHIVDDCAYEDSKRRLLALHKSNVAKTANTLRHKVVHLTELGINKDGILMNTISRKQTEFVNTLSENIVTIVNFNTLLVDYSAMVEYTEALLQFEVNYFLVANELEFELLTN
jgi:hypothetical protein